MLALRTVMELNQPFISAASGLIELGGKFYVIADDENFLASFDISSHAGELFPILSEQLPDDKKLRKKLKKDFESLVHVPLLDQILIVPSGSTEHRMTGALMTSRGELLRLFSFKEFYQTLLPALPELNIEGAVISGEDIIFFQRGNGKETINALIKIKQADLFGVVTSSPEIKIIDLGVLNGVPLSFTDAAMAGKNILFLAAAEATESTYLDGEFMGAVLGVVSPQGLVLAMEPLAISSKPEGLSIAADFQTFFVVTDDDDRRKPSRLLCGKLPQKWITNLL